MPKKPRSLVTGLLTPASASRQSRRTRKPEITPSAPGRRRIIKTLRVDPAVWRELRRYTARRVGAGEAVLIADVVEAALQEYMKRHPA